MMLRTEVIEARGERFTVRELTAKRKAQWAEHVSVDRFSAQYVLASLVCIDPAFTPAQAEEMPAEIIDAIADCGLRLSGMDKPEPKKG